MKQNQPFNKSPGPTAGWRLQFGCPMISFIETNRRIPTVDTVARISRAFGVPCSKLVAEAENKS